MYSYLFMDILSLQLGRLAITALHKLPSKPM
jgi:hypothetical protein